MSRCKHCSEIFDTSDKPKGWMANHSRWCHKNPKRSEYISSMNAINAMNEARKRSGNTNQFTKAVVEGIPIPPGTLKGKPGTFKGKQHTLETKEKMRISALASPHRRLVRGIVDYECKDGTIISLDSSWEYALAERLDELDIGWTRPQPIPWIDEADIRHNYFADFYLPEYNIYLDPKNPQAVKVQKSKLDCLMKQYDNIIIIESLAKCKEFIPT